MSEGKKSHSGELYEWHKAHLLPESERVKATAFTKGYGPNGEYTLMLPSPRIERKIAFVEGRAQVTFADSILKRPDIMALRDKVLRGNVKFDIPSIVWADASLADYSAALLRTVYKLSDEELAMLHSGEQWKEPLIKHAMGGDDVIEAMANMNPDWMTMIEESTRRQREITEQIIRYNMPADEQPAYSNASIGPAPAEVAAEVQAAIASGVALEDLAETVDDEDFAIEQD